MQSRASILLLCLIASLAFANAAGSSNKTSVFDYKSYPKSKYTGYTYVAPPAESIDNLPEYWSWGNVDGRSFLTPSWQQHIPKYCGACWIHGTLSAVQDRIKIANRFNDAPDVVLSRQTIVNCGKARGGFGDGCNGGEAFDVFEYMLQNGLPDNTCENYVAEGTDKCDAESVCMNCMYVPGDQEPHCWAIPEKQVVKFGVTEYGFVSGEADIMSEIIRNGPVTCGMTTPNEFCFGYHGGVWEDHVGGDAVDHDVEVVGWGVDTPENGGKKYWTIRNSWGSYWGENGFFRLERGVNAMHIEDKCAAAKVDVSEFHALLAGKKTGSMFGVIPMDQEPKVFPDGYKHMPHKWIGGEKKAKQTVKTVEEHLEDIWETEKKQMEAQTGPTEPPQAQAQEAESVPVAVTQESSSSVTLMLGVMIGVGMCVAFSAVQGRRAKYNTL